MPIHLYIEHLLNIRTLSIQASLPTSSTSTTHATISADKSILTLTHNNETASIKLPLNLSPRQESTIELAIPPVPQRELSFRVQLEEKDNAQLADGYDRDDGVITPWTADQLTTETEVCCKACGSVVVERSVIKQWKDLPSEGWAEMMDFWHCHKPDHPDGTHSHGSDGELKKGYAAGSTLALQSGVGMVDAMSFVFVAEDCANIKISATKNATKLLCSNPSCASVLGSMDSSTQGYRLHKPSLSISSSSSLPGTSFPKSKWLSLHLLTAVESQGVRKFTVTSTIPDKPKTLKLWVFTPDLLVSTSALETNEPVRVAKILWQEEGRAEDGDDLAGKLSRQALAEGVLDLGGEVEWLVEMLEASSAWLPREGREFAGWRVGLLERFSKTDLGVER